MSAADLNLQFCTAQAVFGASTTVPSTDYIDLKAAIDLAGGNAPVLEVRVTTTFLGGTGARFELTAVDSAGNNPVVLDATPVVATAALLAPTAATPPMGGTIVRLRMSPQKLQPTALRTHLRAQVVNVGTTTAGAVSMQLVPEVASADPTKAVASGY